MRVTHGVRDLRDGTPAPRISVYFRAFPASCSALCPACRGHFAPTRSEFASLSTWEIGNLNAERNMVRGKTFVDRTLAHTLLTREALMDSSNPFRIALLTVSAMSLLLVAEQAHAGKPPQDKPAKSAEDKPALRPSTSRRAFWPVKRRPTSELKKGSTSRPSWNSPNVR